MWQKDAANLWCGTQFRKTSAFLAEPDVGTPSFLYQPGSLGNVPWPPVGLSNANAFVEMGRRPNRKQKLRMTSHTQARCCMHRCLYIIMHTCIEKISMVPLSHKKLESDAKWTLHAVDAVVMEESCWSELVTCTSMAAVPP